MHTIIVYPTNLTLQYNICSVQNRKLICDSGFFPLDTIYLCTIPKIQTSNKTTDPDVFILCMDIFTHSPAVTRKEKNTDSRPVHPQPRQHLSPSADLDVLNGLQWSSAVDEVFKANREREPDIGWQYLGSQLGFLRVYPATWWQPPAHLDGVDLYDVRRRPWYIEAAVSPKDVVILMDM